MEFPKHFLHLMPPLVLAILGLLPWGVAGDTDDATDILFRAETSLHDLGNPQTVYGPTTFLRTEGKPKPVIEYFAVDTPVEACVMMVENGATVPGPGDDGDENLRARIERDH